MNPIRRRARRMLLAVVAACVLAAGVPAVVVLSDRGWSEWLDVSQFQDNR